MLKNLLKFSIALLSLVLLSCGGGGGGSSTAGGAHCGGPYDIDNYICRGGEAQQAKSVKPCNKIPADFCWTGEGPSSFGTGAIGNVRDRCYANAAQFILDPAVCGAIKNDESACFPNDHQFKWKDKCYLDLSDGLPDRSLCNEIKDPTLRRACFRR